MKPTTKPLLFVLTMFWIATCYLVYQYGKQHPDYRVSDLEYKKLRLEATKKAGLYILERKATLPSNCNEEMKSFGEVMVLIIECSRSI